MLIIWIYFLMCRLPDRDAAHQSGMSNGSSRCGSSLQYSSPLPAPYIPVATTPYGYVPNLIDFCFEVKLHFLNLSIWLSRDLSRVCASNIFIKLRRADMYIDIHYLDWWFSKYASLPSPFKQYNLYYFQLKTYIIFLTK